MATTRLDELVSAAFQMLAVRVTEVPFLEMRSRAEASPAPRDFKAALLRAREHGAALIAEIKRASPSKGSFAPDLDAAVIAGQYARGGAACLSVLTDRTHFGGSLADLVAARAGCELPVLRKDFIVTPYQLYEARVAGAGGVLVILRMLEPAQVAALLEAAAELKLFVLLEAFDESDLKFAATLVRDYGPRLKLLVGVNCRDLSTLQVVPGRLETLAPSLPRGVPCVAESGVESAADAARLARAGYQMALVGSALMRTGDRIGLARELLIAGRQCG